MCLRHSVMCVWGRWVGSFMVLGPITSWATVQTVNRILNRGEMDEIIQEYCDSLQNVPICFSNILC